MRDNLGGPSVHALDGEPPRRAPKRNPSRAVVSLLGVGSGRFILRWAGKPSGGLPSAESGALLVGIGIITIIHWALRLLLHLAALFRNAATEIGAVDPLPSCTFTAGIRSRRICAETR